jgi:hypothetical protein
VWTAIVDRRLGAWRDLFACGLGAVAVAGLVALFFGLQGALGPFVRMTIVLPLQWRTHEPMERYLLMTLFSGPVFWGAFAAGLVLSLSEVWQGESRRAGVAVVICGATAHVLGLLFVPAAFYQYYLPLFPLAALLASRAVLGLAGWYRDGAVSERTGRRIRIVAPLVGAAVTVAALGIRLVADMRPELLHPHVRGFVAAMPVPLLITQLVCLFVFALLCVVGARRLACLVLLATVVVAAQPYLSLQFLWSHVPQTKMIEQLMQATDPDEQFFDGFTGYGALRPHSFFYFWINRHSWPMVPDAEKVSGVLHSLSDDRTRVVLCDVFLRDNLPRPVQEFLINNYVPDARYSRPDCVVFVRKGRELP